MFGSPSRSNYYNYLAELAESNVQETESNVDEVEAWHDVFQNKLDCIHNVVYEVIQDDSGVKVWADEVESKLKQFKNEWENDSSIEDELKLHEHKTDIISRSVYVIVEFFIKLIGVCFGIEISFGIHTINYQFRSLKYFRNSNGNSCMIFLHK